MRRLALCSFVALVIPFAVVNAEDGGSPGWGEAQSLDAAAVEAAQIAAIKAVNTAADSFGGVYIDDSGVLVIQDIGDDAARSTVEQRIDPNLPVRWERVERTQADLFRITSEISKLNIDGVLSVWVDTIKNEVDVAVGPGGSFTDVDLLLAKTYGKAVSVESTADPVTPFACNSRANCTLWRGGINVDGVLGCTWGFQASRNGNLHMVTAAHCQAAGGTLTHNGVAVGTNGVGLNAINPATWGEVDVERARVNGQYWPTTQNLLYADNSNKAWALTSVREFNAYAVGQTIALSGRTSGYSDGRITSIFVAYTLTGAYVPHWPNCNPQTGQNCPDVWGMITDAPSAAGDSGAPMYNWYTADVPTGHTLMGFLSGGNAQGTFFVPAYAALGALDLDFWCLTSGCP